MMSHSNLQYRALSEIINAQIIVECMKQVVPVVYLYELAVKLEAIGRGGVLNSPFRELERDRLLEEAGRTRPDIRLFGEVTS